MDITKLNKIKEALQLSLQLDETKKYHTAIQELTIKVEAMMESGEPDFNELISVLRQTKAFINPDQSISESKELTSSNLDAISSDVFITTDYEGTVRIMPAGKDLHTVSIKKGFRIKDSKPQKVEAILDSKGRVLTLKTTAGELNVMKLEPMAARGLDRDDNGGVAMKILMDFAKKGDYFLIDNAGLVYTFIPGKAKGSVDIVLADKMNGKPMVTINDDTPLNVSRSNALFTDRKTEFRLFKVSKKIINRLKSLGYVN